jgi:hypothetical protein
MQTSCHGVSDFERLIFKKLWPIRPFWDGWCEVLHMPDVYGEIWIFISDLTTKASPTGLKWYRNVGHEKKVSVSMDCIEIDCSVEGTCLNGGDCENLKCLCKQCYGGYTCDISPISPYVFDYFQTWVEYHRIMVAMLRHFHGGKVKVAISAAGTILGRQ